MDSHNNKRCPHYQIYSEALKLDGPPAYLAIRRCLLTERMIRLLRQSEEGKELSEKLVIHVANGNNYAFVGPDLDAVTQRSCSVKRCEERCTPAYLQHLSHFSIEDPRQEDVTCNDEEEESSEHLEQETPSAYTKT